MGLQVRRLLLMIAATLIPFSLQSCQREFSKAPARTNQSTADSPSSTTAANNQARVDREGMVLIKGGNFLMGTEDGMSYEAPAHEVTVKTFWMDRREVTVVEFCQVRLSDQLQNGRRELRLVRRL